MVAPMEVTRTPDQVLVIGATGHVGRVFLEQGLELFPDVPIRVAVRDPARCRGDAWRGALV